MKKLTTEEKINNKLEECAKLMKVKFKGARQLDNLLIVVFEG